MRVDSIRRAVTAVEELLDGACGFFSVLREGERVGGTTFFFETIEQKISLRPLSASVHAFDHDEGHMIGFGGCGILQNEPGE